MTERPTYDVIFIVPFGAISLMCFWSIYWNCVVFNMQLDVWGFATGVIGLLSLVAVLNYTLAIRKLRRDFVWETLKNETRNTSN